jgi:hypothetical protein
MQSLKTILLMLAAILAIHVLSACGSAEEYVDRSIVTPSFITKSSDIEYRDRMEATPFVWGGEYHMMISHRESDLIEIYKGRELISAHTSPINFASAIVDAGKLIVIGTASNEVAHIESADLVTWSAPKVTKASIPGRTLYNTSVIKRADGSYLMSYETCEPGTACFNIRFAESSDLNSWTDVGGFFSPNQYAACPTIREVDGVIYMFYLRHIGAQNYATYITRSTDLQSWGESKIVLSPFNTLGEENNASDFDLVEFDGKIVMNYAIGNQLTYSHIKLATYDGTLNQFVQEFFR